MSSQLPIAAGVSILCVLANVPICAQPAALSKLYVDDDAPPGGDGWTWKTAFTHLQDGLAVARKTPTITEIRIAQGMYKPDLGASKTPGDQHAAFDLVSGVALRGGYAGAGAPDPDARDIQAFVTTLSGDLLGNDGPNFTNYSDNSYQVVRAADLDLSSIIEGVTVCGSQMIDTIPPTIGGGLLCSGGGLTVNECRFERNWAWHGGAVAIPNGQVFIANCVFESNRAQFYGGAILAQGGIGRTVELLIEDSSFVGNECVYEDGGAISAGLAGTTIRRCDLVGNAADDGGAIMGRAIVEDCLFQDNFADYGGATSSGGTYRRCRFESNIADVSGGAFASVMSGPLNHGRFIDCEFIENRTNILGGGASYGGAVFINSTFVGNSVAHLMLVPTAPGGAIEATIPCLIANCSFSGNRAGAFVPGAGGGVFVAPDGAATIIGSSFANNSSGAPGSAISGPATVINCAFGNHPTATLAGVQSVNYSCAPIAMTPAGIGNIIADPQFVDPLGPDGIPGTEDDDLRLSETSPCIDAGDTSALPSDEFDLDGDGDTLEALPLDAFCNARVLDLPSAANVGVPGSTGSVVDMGCHEYRRPADVAPPIGDGLVSVVDLLAIISAWGACEANAPCPEDANGDGTVGEADLFLVLQHWG